MQAEKGLSIPSQLELAKNYAKTHDIQVAKEYVDEAESATTDPLDWCRRGDSNPYVGTHTRP